MNSNSSPHSLYAPSSIYWWYMCDTFFINYLEPDKYERPRSENTPATQWLPFVIVARFGSHEQMTLKVWVKVKSCFYKTQPILVVNICTKYDKNPCSGTEFRLTKGRMDGQTDGQSETSMAPLPPLNFVGVWYDNGLSSVQRQIPPLPPNDHTHINGNALVEVVFYFQ